MLSESLGIYGGVLGVLDGVGEAQGGVWYYFTFNFLEFQEVTNQILDIFKLTWHCCYQGPFQEVNIPMNRALLPNCKIESTACLFLKKNLKKTELLKKCYDKLVLPEMPGGIIYKKMFGQYL